MDKSLYSREYRLLIERLRALREDAGITQVELAKRLNATQSFVSKCESGDRRLDAVELRTWCRAVGVSFVGFMTEIDAALAEAESVGRRQKRH